MSFFDKSFLKIGISTLKSFSSKNAGKFIARCCVCLPSVSQFRSVIKTKAQKRSKSLKVEEYQVNQANVELNEVIFQDIKGKIKV